MDRQLGKVAEHTSRPQAGQVPGASGMLTGPGMQQEAGDASFYLEFTSIAAKLRAIFEATRSYAF